MKALKQKHKIKLQHYTESINTQIQQVQSKRLYEFMIINMPFVDDYHVHYTSNTNRLSQAEELGDILLAGVQDLVSIVAEDALGVRDYQNTDDESALIEVFREKLEDEYPSYMVFDVAEPITVTLKKLEKKEKTDTPYYTKLTTLQNEIAKVRQVLNLRHTIQSHLSALGWKFVKIDTAISLVHYKGISAYSDVQRLENEAREICKQLVFSAKEYDNSVEKLSLLTL